MLVQFTWVWVGVILSEMAAAAIPFPLALPNCSDKCGDVAIPYPFGLTEGCYLKDTGDFLIHCKNDSAGQPQPWTGDVVITNISIQGQIDIMMYNSLDCYDESGTPLQNNTPSVGGQNNSSNLFLGSEPYVWALAGLGKKRGK